MFIIEEYEINPIKKNKPITEKLHFNNLLVTQVLISLKTGQKLTRSFSMHCIVTNWLLVEITHFILQRLKIVAMQSLGAFLLISQ